MSDHEEVAEEPKKSSKRHVSVIKRVFIGFVAGLLVGIVGLGAFRYVNVKSDETHYHANFALFVNGQREAFALPTYYEEVQACSGDNQSPRGRVHMHQEEGNKEDSYSIHVHDTAVTWSNFFANLGYALGNGVLYTGSKTYVDGQDGNRLNFYLNGEKVPTIANQVINDKDVLLVSYGTEDDAALKQQYATIPHTAEEHDKTKDPATCSGGHELTAKERFKAAVGLN